jgi:hypothetical protein
MNETIETNIGLHSLVLTFRKKLYSAIAIAGPADAAVCSTRKDADDAAVKSVRADRIEEFGHLDRELMA